MTPSRLRSRSEGQEQVELFRPQFSRAVPPTVAARHPVPSGRRGHMQGTLTQSTLQRRFVAPQQPSSALREHAPSHALLPQLPHGTPPPTYWV